MQVRVSLVPLLFLSCFNPETTKQNSHCDKIWESKDELEKGHRLKVIKDKGRVVGYIDEEYADNIFPFQNQPQQTKIPDVHGNIKSDEKKTRIQNQTIRHENGEKPSRGVCDQKKVFIKEDVDVETKLPDLSKLNFYFSDLKHPTKSPKFGSFKINLKNTNEGLLSDSFFEKLICKVDIIEGDDVTITNWKGDLNINNQKLTAIKRSFPNDNTMSVKFTLNKSTSAKIKISFYVEGNPEKILVVKNGKEETLNL